MKKTIIMTSISCVVAAAILGILLALEIIEIDGFLGKIMLTILILGVASMLSLNSVNMLEKKFNILPMICLLLLAVSSLLAIIIFWADLKWDLFSKLTVIFSIFSILFNFIVSYILRLGKQKLPFQILTYIFMAFFDLIITIQVFDGNILDGVMVKIFIIDIILALLGMAILTIFSKKSNLSESDDYIKITKTEYNNLKAEIAELRQKLNQN